MLHGGHTALHDSRNTRTGRPSIRSPVDCVYLKNADSGRVISLRIKERVLLEDDILFNGENAKLIEKLERLWKRAQAVCVLPKKIWGMECQFVGPLLEFKLSPPAPVEKEKNNKQEKQKEKKKEKQEKEPKKQTNKRQPEDATPAAAKKKRKEEEEEQQEDEDEDEEEPTYDQVSST